MENDNKKNPRIFTSDGIKYLTLPAAIEYTGLNRSTIHQRITRKLIPNIIQEDRYVFIPLDYCEREKIDAGKVKVVHRIQSLKVNFPYDKLIKFIDENTAEK